MGRLWFASSSLVIRIEDSSDQVRGYTMHAAAGLGP